MRKRQLVLELTMAEWNDAIDAYDLRDKEPVIPHREEIKGSVQLKVRPLDKRWTRSESDYRSCLQGKWY